MANEQDDSKKASDGSPTIGDVLSNMETVHKESLAALQVSHIDEPRIRHELSKLHVAVATFAPMLVTMAKAIPTHANPSALEKNLELTKLRGDHLFEASRASDRAVIDFALSGLKGLLIANGGALVAMLTFIGSYRAFPSDAASLWLAFGLFVIGLFTTLGAFVLAYLAQSATSAQQEASAEKIHFHELGGHEAISKQESDEETRNLVLARRLRISAIVSAFLGAGAFVVGCGYGISALISGIPAV